MFTVSELRDTLEELNGDMEVKFVTKAGFVSTVWDCEVQMVEGRPVVYLIEHRWEGQLSADEFDKITKWCPY